MKLQNAEFIYSPSDLSAHLSCNHLTQINKKSLRGEISPPEIRKNRVLDLLRERGIEFEKRYLDQKNADGLTVVEINQEDKDAEQKTLDAMKNGTDLIYQARLKEPGKWSGWADFLIKVSTPSNLGNWSYQVWDTKLATDTKAGTILQIALYSERVAQIQGTQPEFMGVIKPDGEDIYRVDDYAAYVRRVKKNLEEDIALNKETYPEPTAHCDVCQWWNQCESRRRADDHLSYVAGMSSSHIKEFRLNNINTLEQLATAPIPLNFTPSRGAVETFIKLREQARVQSESRNNNNRAIYETLDVVPEKGLNKLPEPSVDDVYLDLEGDPLIEPGGLEYLTGYVYNGQYTALWAKTEQEEKLAFEIFVDFVYQLKQQNPKMHIYHYAPYEVVAFKRLMGKYATREHEIDFLLRSQTFVDLYSVVRQSIRAGVEKYSIKDLERFYNYQRQIDLRTLSSFKSEYEFLLETQRVHEATDQMKDAIRKYNEDDCISTQKLHEWLEQIRTNLIQQGLDITRPELKPGDAGDKVTEHQERIKPIYDALMANVSVARNLRSEDEQARFVLAHMLDWYRREKKSFWWEYFRLQELPEEELFDELKAITGLCPIGERTYVKRSVIDSYSFPAQECDIRVDKPVKNQKGKNVGEVYSVDKENGIIQIKKGAALANEPHPGSICQLEDIPSKDKEAAIIQFAQWVWENGLDSTLSTYRCGRDLLLKLKPRYMQVPPKGNTLLEEAFNRALQLDHSVLPVQGPPGAGKSYTASNMIVKLIREKKKIAIAALSHKVITNLLQKVYDVAQQEGVELKIIQKVAPDFEGELPWDITKDGDDISSGLSQYHVFAGTPYLWCLPKYAEAFDYLFVDEAGQLSLIDTLAIAGAAKNLILLGDPQQLKQPQQGVHPEGTGLSALEHILNGEKTISDDQGVFLSETWRMHPAICAFDSELFYENKLKSVVGLENQKIDGHLKYAGAGLRLEEVSHSGNTSSSVEEADKIREIVESLTRGDVYWINKNQQRVILTKEHIKIITPYNAQVQELQKRLPDVAIGTVDKFQGQEAPVIIYSVATSSPQDAPRGMDFLYSPNRFNVAVSRARGLFIMVMNRSILEPECKSPAQIKLANPFCRLIEMAENLL